MKYRVTVGNGRERTITIFLSTQDIDGLLSGGIVQVRLDKFGIPAPFGQRMYVLSKDTPTVHTYRENKMLPSEWGRVDCIEESHLRDIRDSGREMRLPRDANGLEVILVRQDEMASERQQ